MADYVFPKADCGCTDEIFFDQHEQSRLIGGGNSCKVEEVVIEDLNPVSAGGL